VNFTIRELALVLGGVLVILMLSVYALSIIVGTQAFEKYYGITELELMEKVTECLR
jgi:hypothetical protein